MKIKLISCEALYREFCMVTALSPHVFDVKFMPFGLHDTPTKLREAIQAEIDASEGMDYDYIVLGYGLCSRGTAELVARSVPLVVFRAHDCITILLGSRERYNKEFSENPGTYYYSPGWIERKDGEVQQGFIDEAHAKRVEERYREYVEKYGEENAKFLIDQENQWLDHYKRAAFINTGLGNVEEYRRFTSQLAQNHNWDYSELEGSLNLLQQVAEAKWDSPDLLIVKPGQRVMESFDEQVLNAK